MTGGLLETGIFGLEVAESGRDVNGGDRWAVLDVRHAGARSPQRSQGIVRGCEPREVRVSRNFPKRFDLSPFFCDAKELCCDAAKAISLPDCLTTPRPTRA
jgi:hypothetical protein